MLAGIFLSAPSSAFGQTAPAITPPAAETKVHPVYPPDELASGKRVTVLVRVTVGVDGSVSNPEIIESGGPQFDAAVLNAIRQWKFRPAMQGNAPVAVRVRIPFRFAPPTEAAAAASPDGGASAPPQVAQQPAEAPPPNQGEPDGGTAPRQGSV
ncbi:MAG TPA: energy transducer TonB, partial [Myxococcales bacterium]|nr:energy transducer TonB [Myxococcales bacterium]